MLKIIKKRRRISGSRRDLSFDIEDNSFLSDTKTWCFFTICWGKIIKMIWLIGLCFKFCLFAGVKSFGFTEWKLKFWSGIVKRISEDLLWWWYWLFDHFYCYCKFIIFAFIILVLILIRFIFYVNVILFYLLMSEFNLNKLFVFNKFRSFFLYFIQFKTSNNANLIKTYKKKLTFWVF